MACCITRASKTLFGAKSRRCGRSFTLVSGIRAQVFSNIWPGAPGIWADTALTLVWVVGITASFSILDHMDGLCAGVAAMASLFFAIFALEGDQLLVSTMAAAVLGAAAGFLRWNFKPAKIFMGDGGAGVYRFPQWPRSRSSCAWQFPAITAHRGSVRSSSWAPPFLLIPTLYFPFPARFAVFISFTTPGKDHSAHRLANLFNSQRTAVLIMYSLGAVSGLLALAISHLPTRRSHGGIVLMVLRTRRRRPPRTCPI